MTFKQFIMTYPTQVAINAVIGSSIIYFAFNSGVRVWLNQGISEFSFWQALCVYFLIGVLRGDYRVTIDPTKS